MKDANYLMDEGAACDQIHDLAMDTCDSPLEAVMALLITAVKIAHQGNVPMDQLKATLAETVAALEGGSDVDQVTITTHGPV